FPPRRRSPRLWSRLNRARCASCIGTRIRTSGSTTSRGGRAWACSAPRARLGHFEANDVGYVPFAMGHYIENTGNTTLRFLEIFKSDYYADVSLDQWLAFTPPELVTAHLHSDPTLIRALRKDKVPVVPA